MTMQINISMEMRRQTRVWRVAYSHKLHTGAWTIRTCFAGARYWYSFCHMNKQIEKYICNLMCITNLLTNLIKGVVFRYWRNLQCYSLATFLSRPQLLAGYRTVVLKLLLILCIFQVEKIPALTHVHTQWHANYKRSEYLIDCRVFFSRCFAHIHRKQRQQPARRMQK